MKNRSVSFWGSVPPPIGGMTVHIARLSHLLKENNFKIQMFNFSKIKKYNNGDININNPFLWYISLFFTNSGKIHYVLTTRSYVRFLATIFGLLKNKIIIIRVGGNSLENSINNYTFFKLLDIFSIKFSSAFIGVNERICKFAHNYRKSNIFHVPGFIKPVNNPKNIPPQIKNFLNFKDLKIIVSGRLFKKDELDLYGIRDILNLCKLLEEDNFNYKLVFFLYDMGFDNKRVENDFIKQIKNQNLTKKVMIYNSDVDLSSCLELANLFIRPSYSDGDCNTLREAMFNNLHVIASDCVERPKGTIIYKTGDIQELKNKVISIDINENVTYEVECNSKKIISIIKSIT